MTRPRFYPNYHLKVNHAATVFICVALLWKLWALPRDFPFPFSYINIVGLNKISFGIIVLFILNKVIKNESLALPFPQLKWLLLFFVGIVVSFLYNSNDLGASQLFFLGENDGMLTFKDTINGIGFYVIFLYFFRYKNILDTFFWISTLVAFFFYIALLGGFINEFVGLFGNISPEQLKYSEVGYNIIRVSFPTMDDNTFGPIASILLVIAIYQYLTLPIQQKYYRIFLIVFFILTAGVILNTLSRSSIILVIIQVGIFGATSSKHKLKPILLAVVGFLVVWQLISLRIIPGADVAYALSGRFSEIVDNIPLYKIAVEEGVYISQDNYFARIMLAFSTLPTDIHGWIFGTGGVYTTYSIPNNLTNLGIFASQSHIDLTNWINQWGLITVIPLLIYLFSMIFYLFKWDKSHLRHDLTTTEIKSLFYLKNLGLSLLFGILVMWLNSPLFFLIWLIPGISASIIVCLKSFEIPQVIRGDET